MKHVSAWRAGLLAMFSGLLCGLCLAAPAAAATATPSPSSSSTAAPRAARQAMPIDQQVFGQVQIPAGATVREDIQMVAGNVRVDGHLTGSVDLTAGQVEVGPSGRIDGSVHLAMGQILVQPGGSIGGGVLLSGKTPHRGLSCPRGGPACTLSGAVARTVTIHTGPAFGAGRLDGIRFLQGIGPWIGWVWLGFHLLSWLGMLALALPVAALWPQATAATAQQMRRDPGRSALVGLVAGLLALPTLVLVSITIVGLPVAFAAVLGLIAVWFFGYVALWHLVGTATLALANRTAPHPLLALATGSFLLFLAGWIPVLGGLVWLAASCLGVGATLLTRFGTGTPWLRRGTTPPTVVSGTPD